MEWPEHFAALENDQHRFALEAELQRELKPSHPLFGVSVAAIGRRLDQDDVVFKLLDGTEPVAEVHLTWVGANEQPPWPEAVLFDSYSKWFDSRSKADS